jgi:hypothetical protein
MAGPPASSPAERPTSEAELESFRAEVREWCVQHVPRGWREAQTGVSEIEFVAFQKAWFEELRLAGFATPHWPEEWGGGMPVARQIVLFSELAAHDAPRLVLAFMGIHHAASTLLAAGTDEQRQRHLPAILEGEIWCQGFLGTRGRLGSGQSQDVGPQGRPSLRRQRPKALGELGGAGRLVPPARSNRSQRTQAPGHLLLLDGHANAGSRGAADQERQR